MRSKLLLLFIFLMKKFLKKNKKTIHQIDNPKIILEENSKFFARHFHEIINNK